MIAAADTIGDANSMEASKQVHAIQRDQGAASVDHSDDGGQPW